MYKKILLTLGLLFGMSLGTTAQQWAAKTNLIYWATTTPNLGIEVALSKHSTINISANYNPWTIDSHIKLQHWFVKPEYRYWFTEKYTRAFVSAHLLGGEFDFGGFRPPFRLFDALVQRYYKGSIVALGVGVGYQFYISPHWNLELSAGVGVARLDYDRISRVASEPKRHDTRWMPIPTEIGLSFVYLFNSRK